MRIEFKDAVLIGIDSDIEYIPGYCPTCSIGSKNISKITFTFEENYDRDFKKVEEKFFKIYVELTSEFLKLSISDIVDFIGDGNFTDVTIKEFINEFKEYYSKVGRLNINSIIVRKIEDY